MALSRFLKGAKKPAESAPAAPAAHAPSTGLVALVTQGVTLPPDRAASLQEGMDKGLEFFTAFNEHRLKLAFGSFDEDMKKALYEVLYLLHVNDPSLAGWKYTAIRTERVGGVVKEREEEATAELYMEGAPHGVQGITELSEVYQEDFQEHIRSVFNADVPPSSSFGFCPIVSIHSLGSIGTVGHKSRASDLDLQVQYELVPFLFKPEEWTDDTFKDALSTELKYWVNRYRVQKKLPAAALKDPKTAEGLRASSRAMVSKTYPNLYRYLVAQSGHYGDELRGEQGARRRSQILGEILSLMKRNQKLVHGEEMRKNEAALKERMLRIQNYINAKYPKAEIYLFTCSNDQYRVGNHGSTLVSKEASGSAYELILNYETLMPGIQITPMVPTHFVLPKSVNDDKGMYERVVDYIRFGLLEQFKAVRPRLVDLGATPDLPLSYIAKHSGAVYWEAFKASSGNLPKALLNLFRIEMLTDPRFLKTIIQLIKEPRMLNDLATPKPEDTAEDLDAIVQDKSGLPTWAVLELEHRYPQLLQDPWWVRYKALKIAFGDANGIPGLQPEERGRTSKIIDMAFALHVRISDVFTKPGDQRKFETLREQVLLQFLKRAFPPISPRRTYLEHLFIGEVRSVNSFEKELRELFKRSLNRVNQKIASLKIPGEGNQREFEIWYHYYESNFEPKPNVVQRTILSHLMVPRGRLQIGYDLKTGWFFRSLQKESSVGKRFDTFGHLDHLPEDVMLREGSDFLAGLADCLVNGYYGILNQGTLKETRTVIEFDAARMDLGHRTDNTLAFVRPDNVHRLLSTVILGFPDRPYHYMDCINKKREILDVLVCLNLVKYGRLSVLYRDNLRTWYCDTFDHADLFNKAQMLRNNARAVFTAKPLHVTLARFFKEKGVKLGQVNLQVWVNPNSIETNHSSQQTVLKEQDLAKDFRDLILQVHGPKEDPNAPAGEAPPAAPAEDAAAGAGAAKA